MGSTHVALLRGINVGRAKRVAMADLRALVEGLGYGNVRTLLNSGNVVFTVPPRLAKNNAAKKIEAELEKQCGFSARVTVLSALELTQVVAENSLLKVATDPARMLVAVPANPADRTLLAPLMKQDWGRDTLAIGKRAAYLWCATGVLESRLAAAVNRALGDAVTARNWATIVKLAALTKGDQE